MLFKDEIINTDEFLKVFDKKFSNFCEKAPLVLSYMKTPTSCQLRNLFNQETYEYSFDFTKDVKQNIKDIKDWLVENWYPQMHEYSAIYGEADAVELQKMIREGMSLEDALKSKYIESETSRWWRIEKVILRRDELFVRNLEDDRYYRFKLHMPTTVFLQRLRDRYSPEEAFNVFTQKSSLISELTDSNL